MSRLRSIVKDSEPALVLTTEYIKEKTTRQFTEFPDLEKLRWMAADCSLCLSLEENYHHCDLTGEKIAFIQYTSGSTSEPKGVMVSHGNLLHNQIVCSKLANTSDKTIQVGWMPQYHDYALVGFILHSIYLGTPYIFMSPVSFLQKPVRWLRAITRYRATYSAAPNFAFELCVQKIVPEECDDLDLSSLEVIQNAAEPVQPKTIERFIEVFHKFGFNPEAMIPSYGLAEATLGVSGSAGRRASTPLIKTLLVSALQKNKIEVAISRNADGPEYRKIPGCGYFIPEQKIEIINPDKCERCSADEIGEIWIKGPSVTPGYWGKHDETEKTFRGVLSDTGEGPFLRTGDLGFIQEEQLFIVGRIKDTIIIRGQNHYPQDIEWTLQESHPALNPDCGAAFSIIENDEERLVIVQEIERAYRKQNCNEIFSKICEAVMEGHDLAVHTIILIKAHSIPRTTSGKIKRHSCREKFLEKSLKFVSEWQEETTGKIQITRKLSSSDSVNKKNLVLINPVNPDNTGLTSHPDMIFPPLGLGIIAALTPENFQVQLIDENVELFKYMHADLVGITAFTSAARRAYELAAHYRKNKIPVVMGGIHASMMPDEALNYVDSVVIGEAENVWKDLINDFQNDDLKKIYRGAHLSLVNAPIPRRDLFSSKYSFATVQTSRGCPMDCNFCSVTSFNGKKYRQRPIREILDELESISDRDVFFVDDNIIGYGKRAEARAISLFKGITERGIKIKWLCQASVNFADNEELLKLAAESGCKIVFIGFESIDSDELKVLNKKINLKMDYNRVFEKINKYGIAVCGGIIYGSEAETIENMKNKTEFFLKNRVDAFQASVLTPLPGTRLFTKLERENRLLYNKFPDDWDKFDFSFLTFEIRDIGNFEFLQYLSYCTRRLYSIWGLRKRFIRTLIHTKSIFSARWAYSLNYMYRNVVINAWSRKTGVGQLISDKKDHALKSESVQHEDPETESSLTSFSAISFSQPDVLRIQKLIKEVVAKNINIQPEKIDIRRPFVQFGLDSATAVSVSGELEKRLKRKITPTVFYDYENIEALSVYLAGDSTDKTNTSEKDKVIHSQLNDKPDSNSIAIIGNGLSFPRGRKYCMISGKLCYAKVKILLQKSVDENRSITWIDITRKETNPSRCKSPYGRFFNKHRSF